MTTIPVERELLESACAAIKQRMCTGCEGVPCCMPDALDVLADIRTLLAEQPQAGAGQDAVTKRAVAFIAEQIKAAKEDRATGDEIEDADEAQACYVQASIREKAVDLVNDMLGVILDSVPQPTARHDQGDQGDQVRRLRDALAPFAALAPLFDDGARGGTMPATGAIAAWPRLGANRELIENELTVEHLRAARAALTHSQQGAEE